MLEVAMSAGDAKPFEWVLDARHRPTQILRAGDESAAEAKIYGDKTPEEFGAALDQLIRAGMNPAQAALKLQEQALKDFQSGIDKNTKIVYRAADGTLQERPATATELEALRKKYAKYMKSP
jgi:O-acetylhomoserine/O-acetylserine sulfhydrylase-like pyridoxal-dependent enzyme